MNRAELTAHIKGIDEHFDTIEAAILDIKALLADKKNFWRAWGPPIVAALLAAGATLAAAAIFYS